MQRAARARARPSDGITLVELLLVLVMVAILVAMAIPAFRDRGKGDFEKLVDQLAQDLQSARFQAISAKELRVISINTGARSYSLNSVDPSTAVSAQLRIQPFPTGPAPRGAEVAGYQTGAAEAGRSAPRASATVDIRFSMIGDLQVQGPGLANGPTSGDACTAYCACSITVFLHSLDDRHRARLIVYKTTGYARRLEGW